MPFFTLRPSLSYSEKKRFFRLFKMQKSFIISLKRIVVMFIIWFQRNQKTLFFWGLLFLLFAIFQRNIANKISENPLISQAEVGTSYFDSIYVLLIGGLSLYFLWLWIKNYRVARSFNFWILLLGCSYLFLFRNNTEDDLLLLEFSRIGDSKIFFTDIYLLISLLLLGLYIRNFSKSRRLYDKVAFRVEGWIQSYSGDKRKRENNYFEDLPFDGSIPTHNEIIINTLISRVNNLNPSKAFIIGINGNWGQGKTSFLNRFEYKIKFEGKSDRPIIFWFNPWQHQDERTIIHNFFSTLKKEISVFSGESKSSIDSYVNKVLDTVSSTYSSFIKKTSAILHEEDNISDYYQRVENLISGLNKKIIVFVDDLDRLNKTEILEVLRILRNVANFKNLVFICGVDKNYLIKELKITPKYLNKIFNVEINLPDQTQTNIIIDLKKLISLSSTLKKDEKEELVRSLNEIFDISNEDDSFLVNGILKETEDENFEDQVIPISPTMFLENERETKRFFNFLSTNLSILGNLKNVNLNNFITFNLLIFKFPWMLKLFGNRILNRWLGEEDVLIFDPTKPLIKQFLAEELANMARFDKLVLYNLLKNLFPKDGKSEEGSIEINQRRYFPVYHNINVFNEAFSYSELLENHRKLQLKSFLDSKVKGKPNTNALLADVKKFALRNENLQSEEEFLQLVSLINGDYFPTTTTIETAHFFEKAEIRLEDQVLQFYDKIFTNPENHFGEFLRELNLYYTTKPLDFHSHQNDFYIYFQSVKQKNVKYLKPVLVKTKILDFLRNSIEDNRSYEAISRIFIDCTEKYYQIFEIRFFYEEAKDLFKQYLISNFKDIFLKEDPKKILDFFRPFVILSLFGKKETIQDFMAEIEHLVKQNNFSRNALKDISYYKAGIDEFIDFVQKNNSENLNEEERKKHRYLIGFLFAYKMKDLVYPDERDIVRNETYRRLIENQKRTDS